MSVPHQNLQAIFFSLYIEAFGCKGDPSAIPGPGGSRVKLGRVRVRPAGARRGVSRPGRLLLKGVKSF